MDPREGYLERVNTDGKEVEEKAGVEGKQEVLESLCDVKELPLPAAYRVQLAPEVRVHGTEGEVDGLLVLVS